MANTLYVASNPTDGITTYQKVHIERAPDSSGAPGAFTEIASIAIDSTNENTNYSDTAGAPTDWYRHRWSNTASTVFSSYGANIQAGDYIARQWIVKDIPDADLTTTDWDRWRDQAFQELAANWITKPAVTLSITPASAQSEYSNLNGDMRRVVRVDVYDSAGNYLFQSSDWTQWGRQIRLFNPDTTKVYKVQGVAFLQTWGDVDNELIMLIYWYMRLKYLDKRLADRANFKQFLNSDKNNDLRTPDFVSMRTQALNEFNSRLEKARQTISVPSMTP